MKKCFVFLLAVVMVFGLLSGCGGEEDQKAGQAAEETEEQDTVTLKWGLFSMEMDLADCQEQMNQELKERGLPYRIEFLNLASSFEDDYEAYVDSYIEAVKTSGCDIAECGSVQNCYDVYQMMADAGALASWNEWMENREEGKQVKAAYPDRVWEEVSCDGEIYGLPTVSREFRYYAVVNLNMAEKYKIDPEAVCGPELEAYLRTVMEGEKKAGNPSFLPLASWQYFLLEDYENTNCELITVHREGETLQAENILYNEAYLEQIGRLNRWRKEGLYAQDPGLAQMKDGNFLLAGMFSYAPEAAESQCRALYNLPEDIRLLAVPVQEGDAWLSSSRKLTKHRMGVTAGSAHKEEAFELLSVIYSDEALSNLLAFGREGEDYQMKNGKAVLKEDTLLSMFRTQSFGNSLITLPEVSDPAEKKEELRESVERFPLPGQQGVELYDRELNRKISAINTMLHDEDFYQVLLGEGKDWENELSRLRERAEALGINEVTEEMNRRLADGKEKVE